MKIEGSSVGEEEEKRKGAVRRRRNGAGESNKVIRKRGGFGKRRARSRRRVEAESAAIQRLFEACTVVFKGPGTVPPPQDVEMLQILLGIEMLYKIQHKRNHNHPRATTYFLSLVVKDYRRPN